MYNEIKKENITKQSYNSCKYLGFFNFRRSEVECKLAIGGTIFSVAIWMLVVLVCPCFMVSNNSMFVNVNCQLYSMNWKKLILITIMHLL
jgi:hypothetical protein